MVRTAADLMRRKVITIDPAASLKELAVLLDEAGIHGVPVVDGGGGLVGVVSRTDLMSTMTDVEAAIAPAPRFYAIDADDIEWDSVSSRPYSELEADKVVADVMSTRLVKARPDHTAAALARKMRREKVQRLLILEGRDLVGIVTTSDVLRACIAYEKELGGAPRKKAAKKPARKAGKGSKAAARKKGKKARAR